MDYNKLAEAFLVQVKDTAKSQVMNKLNSYSHGENQVLFFLHKQTGEPIVPSDIATFTNTSTARIATILNNLEEKGMVTREISRVDRRKILVALTDKGRKLAETQRCTFINNISRAFEAMGEERATRFVDDLLLFFEEGRKIALEEEENKNA
ncbi:MarR family winged helix-turn-helix transcriptional regulator [Lactococcus nasutitermitis]|uniref:MarR family winged helix-turn-helix transcriptional regulator n=1 Tax=Lactococcus nasutitermitis TaxID=1652957 RepID=A0ABV9JEL1_9LACT|nr:MarR family transcriptional regulator [Lactococcus nasutitermitis]